MDSRLSNHATDRGPRVGVVGTGSMGSALAAAASRAGNLVTVWNRTAAKAERLAAIGCEVAPTPEDVANASDVVIVCVTDAQAGETLFERPEFWGSLRNRIVVYMTTIAADSARELEQRATADGIGYVHGSVLVDSDMVATDEALLVFAGRTEVYESAQSVLNAFGRCLHLGEKPDLAATGMVLTLPMYHLVMLATLQAFAMGQTEGISPDHLAEIVVGMVPTVRSVCESVTARLVPSSPGDIGISTGSNIRNNRLSVDLCRTHGLDTDLTAVIGTYFERARREQLADQDVSAMLRLFQEPRLGRS